MQLIAVAPQAATSTATGPQPRPSHSEPPSAARDPPPTCCPGHDGEARQDTVQGTEASGLLQVIIRRRTPPLFRLDSGKGADTTRTQPNKGRAQVGETSLGARIRTKRNTALATHRTGSHGSGGKRNYHDRPYLQGIQVPVCPINGSYDARGHTQQTTNMKRGEGPKIPPAASGSPEKLQLNW